MDTCGDKLNNIVIKTIFFLAVFFLLGNAWYCIGYVTDTRLPTIQLGLLILFFIVGYVFGSQFVLQKIVFKIK